MTTPVVPPPGPSLLARPPLPAEAATRLVWLDCEMTGLDPDAHRIIEIATLVTDAELTVLAEGPVIAVHQPGVELAKMDDWNTRQHGRSGLTLRVQESTTSEAMAVEATLAFLRLWVPEGKSPMCGNTICQDRRFLARHMPKLEAFFHYRNIDVSTIKELAARWAPGLAKGFTKSGRHLALDDIRDSVAEMKYWREHAMKI